MSTANTPSGPSGPAERSGPNEPTGPTGPTELAGPTEPTGPTGPTGPADGPPPPQSPIHAQPPTPPLDPHAPAHQPPHPPPHQSPHPPAHPPDAAARPIGPLTVPLGKMLYLCVAALGVINLFLGFVNNSDDLASVNLYKAGVAVFALAPTMLFLAGLVAVRGWLPGERSPGPLPAMISTAIFVTLVLSALGSEGAGDLQTLFLVFGGLQFVTAWLAYLFDVGVITGR